ncbi:MAG: S41 family peptidase [Pseudomonadota bacterium]
MLKFLLSLSFVLLIIASAQAQSDTEASPAFDATAAWSEYQSLLEEKYAYIDRTDFDVTAYLSRAGEIASTLQSEEEMRDFIHRSTYAFTDPHLIVGPFVESDFNIIPTVSHLWIDYSDGAYRLADVRRTGTMTGKGLETGLILTHVNDEPVDESVARIFEGLLETPTGKQKAYAATLLANGRRDGASVTVRFETETGDVLEAVLDDPRTFAVTVSEMPPLSYRTQDDVGIIRINNSLGNNQTIIAFDDAMQALGDNRAIIIDLRNTPSGGNTEVARSIIGHFIDEVRPYQVHEVPAFNREFTVPRRYAEYVFPRADYYDGPLIVLGSRWTGSMGEGLVIGLDAAAGAYTMTSDMGDLLGGLWNYDLRSMAARVDLGGEALFHVDGTRRENYQPDLFIENADNGGSVEDPAIEAAIACVEDQTCTTREIKDLIMRPSRALE